MFSSLFLKNLERIEVLNMGPLYLDKIFIRVMKRKLIFICYTIAASKPFYLLETLVVSVN